MATVASLITQSLIQSSSALLDRAVDALRQRFVATGPMVQYTGYWPMPNASMQCIERFSRFAVRRVDDCTWPNSEGLPHLSHRTTGDRNWNRGCGKTRNHADSIVFGTREGSEALKALLQPSQLTSMNVDQAATYYLQRHYHQ